MVKITDEETIRADAIKASARIIKIQLDSMGKWISEDVALDLARKVYIAHEMVLWQDIRALSTADMIGPEPQGFFAKRRYWKEREKLKDLRGNFRPAVHTLDELDALNKEWFF